MNGVQAVDEVDVREALHAYARARIPEGSDLRGRVRARLSEPRHLGVRWSARSGGALAAAGLVLAVSAGVVFAQPQNRQVVVNFVTRSAPPPVKSHRTLSIPLGQAAGRTPSAADLASAQRRAGFRLVVPSRSTGAELERVRYFGWAPDSPHGGVSLTYRVGTRTFDVLETLDTGPRSSPLQIDIPSDARLVGIRPPAVETIEGSEYAVVRTTDGSRIVFVEWETQDGVRVRVSGDPPGDGTDPAAFTAFITHMS